MALQTSGPISLNDIHVEAGGSSGSSATINDADIRDMIGKGSGSTMSFNEWYGASSGISVSGNSLYALSNGVQSAPYGGIAFTYAPNLNIDTTTTGITTLGTAMGSYPSYLRVGLSFGLNQGTTPTCYPRLINIIEPTQTTKVLSSGQPNNFSQATISLTNNTGTVTYVINRTQMSFSSSWINNNSKRGAHTYSINGNPPSNYVSRTGNLSSNTNWSWSVKFT